MSLKIFFDGGCRPNPGAIELAVVARGVVDFRADAGLGSNDDAEWLAAIHALAVAARIGARDVVLLGDSATMVDQANGRARCGAAAAAHQAAFETLRRGFDRVRVRRIGRAQNLAGIHLSKRHSGR